MNFFYFYVFNKLHKELNSKHLPQSLIRKLRFKKFRTVVSEVSFFVGNPHPGLTRERSIRSLLFEIKCVFVYNSLIFKLTDLLILYFFIQNVYANKKVFCNKGQNIMYKGSNCDRKSQFPETLTEPLNPRVVTMKP